MKASGSATEGGCGGSGGGVPVHRCVGMHSHMNAHMVCCVLLHAISRPLGVTEITCKKVQKKQIIF